MWTLFLSHMFTFAAMWSMAGNVDSASMLKFDDFVRTTLSTAVLFPGSSAPIFEFFVERDGGFRPWEEITPSFIYKENIPYFQLVVPTLDTCRFSLLLQVRPYYLLWESFFLGMQFVYTGYKQLELFFAGMIFSWV